MKGQQAVSRNPSKGLHIDVKSAFKFRRSQQGVTQANTPPENLTTTHLKIGGSSPKATLPLQSARTIAEPCSALTPTTLTGIRRNITFVRLLR
jgi:hypothetical protein